MQDNEAPAENQTIENDQEASEEVEPQEPQTGEETTPNAVPEQGIAQETTIEDDDDIIIIDDEDAPSSEEPAPAWVKELRKTHRDTVKENRELRQQLEAIKKPKDEYIHLGEKPTLASVDYDDERFEQELTSWYDRKRQIEAKELEQQQQYQAQEQEWHQKVNSYREKKSQLSFKDVDEAESIVQSFLNVTQQGLIVQGADNPALVVYALGKNPNKAQKLAAIKDPVKFAFEIAKMEAKLNVKSRKARTQPEKTISGNAPVAGSVDSQLEKLRAEAERTGNYTKVSQYRRDKLKARK